MRDINDLTLYDIEELSTEELENYLHEIISKIINKYGMENVENSHVNITDDLNVEEANVLDVATDNGLKHINYDSKVFNLYKIETEYKNYFYLSALNVSERDIIDYDFFHDNHDNLINNEYIGEYYPCNNCDGLVFTDNIYVTDDNMYLCQHCWDENVITCSYCGNTTTLNYEVEDGIFICEECYNEIERKKELKEKVDDIFDDTLTEFTNISHYNSIDGHHDYSRYFIKRKIKNIDEALEKVNNDIIDKEILKRMDIDLLNNIYIGCEEEVEAYDGKRHEMAYWLRENLNCIVADDGSLNEGLEIISDPQTMLYWLIRYDRIKKVFEKLIEEDFRSDETSTCGLHFHVGREILGETEEEQNETIARIELIMQNFKEELKIFSRRKGNFSYCYFLSDNIYDFEKTYGDILSLNVIKKAQDDLSKKDRYYALNLTNKETIEFRFCKGSLNIQTFYASLELIYNIIEMALKGDIVGKTFNQLVNMNGFKHLKNYVLLRNIKALKRIKDHTQVFLKELQKRDKKYIKMANKTDLIIEKLKEFYRNNYHLLFKIDEFIRTFERSTSINKFDNIMENCFQNITSKIIKYRGIINAIENLRYFKNSYVTSLNETIYYVPSESLERAIEIIDFIPDFLNDIKEFERGEMSCVS